MNSFGCSRFCLFIAINIRKFQADEQLCSETANLAHDLLTNLDRIITGAPEVVVTSLIRLIQRSPAVGLVDQESLSFQVSDNRHGGQSSGK